MRLTRRTLLSLAGAAAMPRPAAAQEWPARPIRLIVGTSPGGSPDIIGRVLGEKLADRLGQSVFIENITQGAGAVAYQIVSDPVSGFSFVTLLCGYPMVYAVAPASPIKSFGELLAQAKASPGRITYSITALGSIYHVLTKWIEIESGALMTPVSYRGTAQALSDVLAGRVDLMVDAATSAFPRIQAGQLRVLAISSPGRYPLMREAPTVAETVPGVEFMSWLGLAMPPDTPRAIVDRINKETRAALELPDVQQRLLEGGNVASPSTPEEMRQRVESEIARWSRVIETAGIKGE